MYDVMYNYINKNTDSSYNVFFYCAYCLSLEIVASRVYIAIGLTCMLKMILKFNSNLT